MAENSSLGFKFPKELRLLSRYDFERAKKGARRLYGKYLLLEVVSSSKNASRLGITVTKKYGTSPQRNRFKRLCRELFRLSKEMIPCHLDIHLRPKMGEEKVMHTISMGELQNDFCMLIAKISIVSHT